MTYDCMLGIVLVEVDTAHIHGRIGRRCGDNDLFGTTLQMSRSPEIIQRIDISEYSVVLAAIGKRPQINALIDGGENTLCSIIQSDGGGLLGGIEQTYG